MDRRSQFEICGRVVQKGNLLIEVSVDCSLYGGCADHHSAPAQ
jgi:hypothetical protein